MEALEAFEADVVAPDSTLTPSNAEAGAGGRRVSGQEARVGAKLSAPSVGRTFAQSPSPSIPAPSSWLPPPPPVIEQPRAADF